MLSIESILDGTGFEDLEVQRTEESLVFISAAQVLAGQAVGNAWKFEGVVVACDEQPREYAANVKRSQSQESTGSALDMLMVDKTGPVMVTLWDSAVTEFQQMVPRPAPSGSQMTLLLSRLRVGELPKSEWNGSLLTPIYGLHSVTGVGPQSKTIVAVSNQNTSSYMIL